MTEPAADAAFVERYRVRFDECGPDGLVRTGSLLRYAQDIAWRHSEDRGFDRSWYADQRLAWLVRAGSLEVRAPIPIAARLEVRTRVVGWRKVWARRTTDVALEDGRTAAVAVTDWVLVDDEGRPRRIPEVFAETFSGVRLDEPITRVDVPPTPPDALAATFRVRPQEVDPNDHVNNAVYLDWLEERLTAVGPPSSTDLVTRMIPRRYAVEYASAARAGQDVTTTAWSDRTGWWCRVSDAGGGDIVRARVERTVADAG